MDVTAEQEALKIAGQLIDAGVPVFAAAPDPDRPGEYFYPKGWEQTVPSHEWLKRWRPGWALAAVGGGPADFLDFDPRNGGAESMRELELQGQMPRSFGRQRTPSGGTHEVISPTGERKSTGFMPGVDLQSGDANGEGRGFVWIAPTVRPSKAPETLGELRPYVWEVEPDLEYLKEFSPGSDESLEGVIARVHAKRGAAPTRNVYEELSGGQLFVNPRTPFTMEQAQSFCLTYLEALERAPIGQIEEHCNVAATALSHFVPAFWDADRAMAVLKVSLSKTAYDPDHPASTWTVDKFYPVLTGARPPRDNWKATRELSPAEAAAAFGQGEDRAAAPSSAEQAQDMIDALIGRMLTAEQMMATEAPQPLVWDLLDLDTLAALVGMPGSFKSFIALDLAAHVGTGRDWHGRKVTQGEVVYIVAEGARGMALRTRAWRERHGHMSGVRFLPEPVQVNDTVAWQTLVEACRRLKPAMVVIDTQAQVTLGTNENDNGLMSGVYGQFRRIKDATGACVLIVHHTGKSGETTRGAGSQDGAQDTRIKLERVNPRSSMIVNLRDEKQKDMAETEDGLKLLLETVDLGVDPKSGRRLSSLVVADDNAFKLAAGTEEPEQWVAASISVTDMVVRVLSDHGQSRGLTKSETHATVIERFYGGVKDRLNKSTWHTSWNRALEREEVINTGGERFTVDTLGSEEMS